MGIAACRFGSGVIAVVVAVLAFGLPGCSISRPARTEEQLAEHRRNEIKEMIDGRIDLSRTAVRRVLAERAAEAAAGRDPAGQTVDMLILSGGGDYGAFGAGVLKGWGEVADPTWSRPEFDVVTGVSTGALIAPLAFAGTDEAYERAFRIYQDPKPDWFKERGLIEFLFRKQSLTDTKGLRKEVVNTMDESIINAIANGHRNDRVLVVGTTNLDLGLMTMWDLAGVADRVSRGEQEREHFHDIVMASAAIPAVFPPVEINGDLHVDGGVTRNIAYTTDQKFSGSVLNIMAREYPNEPPLRLRIWVIVNNQLGTPMKDMQPDWPSLMGRSLAISIRSSTTASLKGLELAAELVQAKKLGVFEFRYMAIPEDWRPVVDKPFNKETMVSLAELGYELGRNPDSWRTAVPNPESPTGDEHDTNGYPQE